MYMFEIRMRRLNFQLSFWGGAAGGAGRSLVFLRRSLLSGICTSGSGEDFARDLLCDFESDLASDLESDLAVSISTSDGGWKGIVSSLSVFFAIASVVVFKTVSTLSVFLVKSGITLFSLETGSSISMSDVG